MMRLKRMVLAVAMGGMAAGVMGQMSIEPPSTTEPTSAPAVVAPKVDAGTGAMGGGAATMPSAQNVLEGLLKEQPGGGATMAVPTTMGTVNRALESPVTEAAPNAPKSTRVREGESIWGKTGRLVKDEKTGNWFFAFESDGKNMKDPPMTLIPSRLLKVMEDASGGGTQVMRFKVSGLVTEYGEKNYLWVQHVEILRELNKGIGG